MSGTASMQGMRFFVVVWLLLVGYVAERQCKVPDMVDGLCFHKLCSNESPMMTSPNCATLPCSQHAGSGLCINNN